LSVRFFNRFNFKIALFFIVIILFISASGATGLAQTLTEDEKAARAFKFAKGLFDMQKYKQAASELQKFIAFYEKSRYGEYALYLLGESLYKTEDYKDALDKYELFQKKYKDSKLVEEVYYSSAYTLLSLDKPEEAHAYFLKLYNSQNPDLNRDAVYKCARHLIDKKETAGAKKAFDDYFKLIGARQDSLEEAESERYKEALYISGNLSLREKREKDAVDYYEKFLKSFSADPMAAPVYYNIGEILYSKGQYKKAVENYNLAMANLEAEGKTGKAAGAYSAYIPKIHYSSGWCFYSQSNFKEAADHFSKCFNGYDKFENRADCGLRLGISLFNLKNYDQAARVFKEVKKIKGLSAKISAETDYYLGMALQKNGLLSEALDSFLTVADSSDEIGVEALYAGAVILFDQKKYEEAIAKFRALLSRFPSSLKAPNAAFNIGLAYFNMAKYKEAREALLNFTNNFQSSNYLFRSYFNLGEISMIEKSYEEAITWFAKIPSGDNIWLEADLKICDAYFALKDFKKLSEKYRQIITAVDTAAADSDYIVPALFKMGKNLAALNENELARRAYEKIIQLSKSPRNLSDAKYRLALIYFETKNYDKCLAACDELLTQKDVNGNTFSLYELRDLKGRAKNALADYDGAIAIFDEILSSSDAPEHIRLQTRFNKAMVYNDKKDYPKAVENFELLASDAQDIELLAKIHYLLGDAYYAMNNTEEAVKNLLKVEILFKDTAVINDARLKLLEIYVKTRQKKDAKNLRADIMKSSAPKAIKDRANELFKK